MKINWREKFVAFVVHFLVTAVLGLLAAALIFRVWYPSPFAEMLGGVKLFVLVVGCDLALGPLLSLVVYNGQKARHLLVLDYTVIAIVQLAALGYGIYTVSAARPAYIVFTAEGLQVTPAHDLLDEYLARAREPYRTRPLWGPRLVGFRLPSDTDTQKKVLLESLQGVAFATMPQWYVSYDERIAEPKQANQRRPLAALERNHAGAIPMVRAAAAELSIADADIRWLPVKSPRGYWLAILDPKTSRPVRYLPIDPN
jgi:hypothetical protein